MAGTIFKAALTVYLASFAAATPCQKGPGSPAAYEWEDLPSLPFPRQEHSVARIGHKIYIIGGITSNVSFTVDTDFSAVEVRPVSDVHVYDIKAREWSDAAPMPISINHGNAAAVDGKIYMLGGLSGTNMSSWNALPNSYVYDPEDDSWAELPSMPSDTARGGAAIGVHKSSIFLAGGLTKLELFEGGEQLSVATVTSFDTKTQKWNTALPQLPGPRDHVGGAVIGSTFYVTGGRENGQENTHGDTWALALRRPKSWRDQASMPTARGGISTAAVGRYIFTFGGEGNPDLPTGVFDDVEVFDTKRGEWIVAEAMSVPRHGMGAVGFEGEVYVPGGGVLFGGGPVDMMTVFRPKRHGI
jgi:N-acetylneuraminic acid mutarotase